MVCLPCDSRRADGSRSHLRDRECWRLLVRSHGKGRGGRLQRQGDVATSQARGDEERGVLSWQWSRTRPLVDPPSVYFAYFDLYSYERHLVAKCAAAATMAVASRTCTPWGRRWMDARSTAWWWNGQAAGVGHPSPAPGRVDGRILRGGTADAPAGPRLEWAGRRAHRDAPLIHFHRAVDEPGRREACASMPAVPTSTASGRARVTTRRRRSSARPKCFTFWAPWTGRVWTPLSTCTVTKRCRLPSAQVRGVRRLGRASTLQRPLSAPSRKPDMQSIRLHARCAAGGQPCDLFQPGRAAHGCLGVTLEVPFGLRRRAAR